MCNKSACARYNFDLFSTTLTISKEFEKRAAIPGSIEQLTFCQLMATYGDVFKGMPQAAVVTKGMVFVLPQFCRINRNLINGAAQFL
jgi:hypothetical protein